MVSLFYLVVLFDGSVVVAGYGPCDELMPCYHPWRLPNGDGTPLRCGQCRGCRASWSREWAMRCMHEADVHQVPCDCCTPPVVHGNTFLTLTYAPEHLPAKASLDREAFPVFIRALRKRIAPQKVRYFHVGEYGTINHRPHYHALLFGFRPDDQKMLAMRGDNPVFTSELLSGLWKQGIAEFGDVTPASALYCAGYMKRKMTGSWAKQKYGERVPEYGTMSRNPGIGAKWIDKFGCEVYPQDGCVVRGAVVKPPRYYDLRYERVSPVDVDSARYKRFLARRVENETGERLKVREMCAIAREDFNETRDL